MRLHEFEAADIFESMGIPVPRRGVASSVQEAVHVAGEIGYPVMLKAQVLVGGRCPAGRGFEGHADAAGAADRQNSAAGVSLGEVAADGETANDEDRGARILEGDESARLLLVPTACVAKVREAGESVAPGPAPVPTTA